MGSWIAQRLQIPHIIHIREFGNKNTYWGPSNLKRINKTSNRVIVISKALAKEIEKAVEKSKMVISYDGVIYQGKEKQKSDEYVDILLTGRITEAKSQEEAVMAIAELKKRGLSELVRLHFAGSVPVNSKFARRYYNRILDLIKKYNIEKQIIFHGEVSSMDLLRQNMDIELMCAERETFGWVTVEGMRSGLLVIGANTGATPEIITNMKTGLLYTHGDARDLADKIEWVLKNPSSADEIRKNGKKFSDESFTIEENGTDPYLLTYAKSLYNRESCGNCRAKQFPRISDITLGDFWQIDTVKQIPRDIKVNQGISVILANSLKGQQIINDIQDSMKLFEIPENTFSNMKARYSECHSRSIMSEQFVKDTEKNGFSIAAHRMTNKRTLVKEWSRFRWLSFKRLIRRYS